jgi:hypothetical protein
MFFIIVSDSYISHTTGTIVALPFECSNKGESYDEEADCHTLSPVVPSGTTGNVCGG